MTDLSAGAPSRNILILFRVVALVIALALVEVFSTVIVVFVKYPRILRARSLYAEQSEQIRQYLDPHVPHHTEIHPVLGWRHAPNFPDPVNRMNSAALRGSREYSRTPPIGVLRVAAFGDSFVYGAEVDSGTAWAGLIESHNADIEVLNYGVAGYGVDQAYLRYMLEGDTFSPNVVLMGFVPDDINRLISVYRRFLSPGAALFKPRYTLTDRGELALLEVPLKTRADYENLLSNPGKITAIGRTDYWYSPCVYENPLHDYSATLRLACGAGGLAYRRYVDADRPVKGAFLNENSTAFKIQVALFSEFTTAVRHNSAVPLVLMLPDIKSMERLRHGQFTIYEPLLRYMRSHDIAYLDAAEAFSDRSLAADTSTWFTAGGHYSPAGNQIVATWLTGKLRGVASFRSEPPSDHTATAQPPHLLGSR